MFTSGPSPVLIVTIGPFSVRDVDKWAICMSLILTSGPLSVLMLTSGTFSVPYVNT